MKQWSRPFLPVMLLVWVGVAMGCSEGAKLMKETETGGIVVYPFKGESGYMYSKLRKDAFEIIEQRCPAGYTVVKEAEAKGRVRVQELAGTQDVITERRWGIQFRCK